MQQLARGSGARHAPQHLHIPRTVSTCTWAACLAPGLPHGRRSLLQLPTLACPNPRGSAAQTSPAALYYVRATSAAASQHSRWRLPTSIGAGCMLPARQRVHCRTPQLAPCCALHRTSLRTALHCTRSGLSRHAGLTFGRMWFYRCAQRAGASSAVRPASGRAALSKHRTSMTPPVPRSRHRTAPHSAAPSALGPGGATSWALRPDTPVRPDNTCVRPAQGDGDQAAAGVEGDCGEPDRALRGAPHHAVRCRCLGWLLWAGGCWGLLGAAGRCSGLVRSCLMGLPGVRPSRPPPTTRPPPPAGPCWATSRRAGGQRAAPRAASPTTPPTTPPPPPRQRPRLLRRRAPTPLTAPSATTRRATRCWRRSTTCRCASRPAPRRSGPSPRSTLAPPTPIRPSPIGASPTPPAACLSPPRSWPSCAATSTRTCASSCTARTTTRRSSTVSRRSSSRCGGPQPAAGPALLPLLLLRVRPAAPAALLPCCCCCWRS
jgi:hypothetical protein